MLNKFKKCSQGRSHIAEDAQDRQLQLFSEKNYYIPHVGNIYHSYVGVSNNLNRSVMEERSKIRPYALKLLYELGAKLDDKDKLYSLKCFPAYEKLINHPNIVNILIYLIYYIRSYDFSIKGSSSVGRFIFAIRRRIPHSNPINM